MGYKNVRITVYFTLVGPPLQYRDTLLVNLNNALAFSTQVKTLCASLYVYMHACVHMLLLAGNMCRLGNFGF